MGKQIKLSGVTFTNAASLPQFVLARNLAGTVSTSATLPTVSPYDICWTPNGAKAYLCGNNAIVEYVAATGALTTVAGLVGTAGGTDGVGAAARFGTPAALAIDPTGTYLYITDATRNTVRRMTLADYTVTTIAGTDNVTGAADGTGTAATFTSLYGCAISNDGATLYVSSHTANRIAKITLSSGVVSTLSTAAVKTLVLSRAGDYLYGADGNSNVIRRIAVVNGTSTTIAGSGVASSVDGTGIAATFNNPWGIEIDPTDSYLYVTEFGGHVLRRINLRAANVVTTVAGVAASGATDGTGAAARFNQPLGMQFKPGTDGVELYVAAFGGKTIRKVI